MARAKTTLANANANENTLLDYAGLDEYTKKLIVKLLGMFAMQGSVPDKAELLNALGYSELKDCQILCNDGGYVLADILVSNVRDNRVGHGKVDEMTVDAGISGI